MSRRRFHFVIGIRLLCQNGGRILVAYVKVQYNTTTLEAKSNFTLAREDSLHRRMTQLLNYNKHNGLDIK